jgi:hypothetical protein
MLDVLGEHMAALLSLGLPVALVLDVTPATSGTSYSTTMVAASTADIFFGLLVSDANSCGTNI